MRMPTPRFATSGARFVPCLLMLALAVSGAGCKLLDSDDDGLTDFGEKWFHGTDPEDPDSDGDLLSDGLEDADGDEVSRIRSLGFGPATTRFPRHTSSTMPPTSTATGISTRSSAGASARPRSGSKTPARIRRIPTATATGSTTARR